MSENTKNEIELLGEFGLIDELTGDFELNKGSSIKGIGDDCAVISSDGNSCKLLSADMLVEGVHFNLSYMPLKSLGFKAVSVNVSDVYAMNGKPEQNQSIKYLAFPNHHLLFHRPYQKKFDHNHQRRKPLKCPAMKG